MLRVGTAQVLAFRLRRQGLTAGGHGDVVAAARAVVGAQSQQEGASVHGLAARTAGFPTARDVAEALRSEPRSLVRTWGQRDTVHVYDVADWATVLAAKTVWKQTERSGTHAPDGDLDAARGIAAGLGVVCRDDLVPALSAAYTATLQPLADKAKMDVRTIAAGRLLQGLCRRGDLTFAGKRGSTALYAARAAWFPELDWPDLDPDAAAASLVERYLAAYGPATAKDVAHFFGANAGAAKRWLATLETVDVDCGGRPGLLARAADAEALAAPAGDPGLVVLPRWDGYLMGHADKSWTVPDEAERPLVWRRMAQIPATVLGGGRVVATLKQKVSGRRLKTELEPLSGWRKAWTRALDEALAEVAAHRGLIPA